MWWTAAYTAATIALGVLVGTGPTAVDTWIATRLGGPSPLWDTLSLTTHPATTVGIIAATALTARRSPRVALSAAAAPALAVLLSTYALKPLFGRTIADHLAYPSGHTTALVAVLAVLVLATAKEWLLLVVPVVVVAGAAVVGMGYHYATDVVGAVLWASAVATFLWGTLGRTADGLGKRRSVVGGAPTIT